MNAIPSNLPEFVRGVHYRRSGSGRWKWVTLLPVVICFTRPLFRRSARYRCLDGNGKAWLEIEADRLTLAAGYAWNGSSFSPDLRGVMLASCVHDALYQFSGCAGWPESLTREWADELFYHLATSRLRLLYALGLAIGSSVFWARRPGDGSRVEKLNLLD